MAGAKYRHQASVTPLKEKLFQEHLKMRGKEAERTCVVDVGHLANGWGLAGAPSRPESAETIERGQQ